MSYRKLPRNNKEKIKYISALHPIQEKLLELFANNEIQYGSFGTLGKSKNSLREIGAKANIKNSPQQVKHHLTQLIRYGFMDIINGKYIVNKKYK